MPPILITLLTAFFLSLCITPLVRWWAIKYDLVDSPEPHRKLHHHTVPLGGGIAVLVATTMSVGLTVLWSGEISTAWSQSKNDLLSLLFASLILCIVGLADDLWNLRGRQKLLGQVLSIGVLLYSGVLIRDVQIFQWHIQLGILAIPFTMFWLLGAINALNLLDGADGFATTIGIIICGTIGGMAVLQGSPVEAMVSVAVAGALLGFFLFNSPPASIFLGDAGSMLIGLAVGVLAIQSSLKGPATVALSAPLAILAIPIFDSSAALVRRIFTGRSVYMGDRGHLHHSLLRGGFGPRGLLVGVALMCTFTSSGAFLSLFLQNEFFALGSVSCVLGVLIASRIFGFRELVLVANRTLAFGNSLMATTSQNNCLVREENIHLQGSRNWDELWNTLTDFAKRHELSQVRLNLNLAWLHEGYHAVWERNERRYSEDTWLTRLPISVNGQSLGRVELIGHLSRGKVHAVLAKMAEMLESLEPCIAALVKELPQDKIDASAPPVNGQSTVTNNAAKPSADEFRLAVNSTQQSTHP